MTRSDALVHLAGAWAASGICQASRQRSGPEQAAEAARKTLDALAAEGDLEFDLNRSQELEQLPQRLMDALEQIGVIGPVPAGGSDAAH